MIKNILFTLIIGITVAFSSIGQVTNYKYDCNSANDDSVYVTITEPSCFGVFDGEIYIRFVPDPSLPSIDQSLPLNSIIIVGTNNGFQNSGFTNTLDHDFTNLQPDNGMSGITQMRQVSDGSYRVCGFGPFTVNSIPQASSPAINGPTEICEDETDILYDIVPNAGATYQWYNLQGDATITTPTNLDNISVDFGSSNVRLGLRETDAKGCDADTSIINVNVNPTPSLPTISGDNALCANTKGEVYTASGDPSSTYNWFVNGAVLAGTSGQTATIDFGTSNATIKVVEETPSSCASDTATFNVSIENLPSSTNITGSTVVCENTTGEVYTASGTGGNNFNWIVTGATPSSTTGSSISVDFGSSDATIAVAEQSPTGCIGDTVDLAVDVIVQPTPVITGSNQVCAGTKLEPYSVSGLPSSSFQWIITDAIGSSTTNPNITVNFGATDAVLSVVETPAGASSCKSDPVNFPVDVIDKPNTVLSGPSSICANTTGINFSATGEAGSTFDWFVSGATIASDNGDNINVDFGTTNAVIKVLEQGVSCAGDTQRINVTVNALPIVTTNGDQTICEGDSVLLTASGATTYQWSPATGLLSPNSSATYAKPSSTTVYTVRGINGSGCEATAALTVNVNTLPTASISPNNPSICEGESVNLIASGGTSYEWTPSTGLSNPNIANPVATPNTSTTYKVKAFNGVGCADSTYVTVTVNAIPTVNPTATPSTICAGETVQLNTTNDAAYTYNWTPAGSLDNASISNPVASPATTTTYNVTVNDGTCSETGSVTVNVNALPTASVTPFSSDTICKGESVTLAASGGVNYSWSPTTGLTNPNAASTIATPTSQTEYTVTVEDANGCEATASTTIYIDPVININITAGDSICTGDQTTLSATATNAASFSWSPTTGLSDPNSLITDAAPTTTTTYTLTVTNSIGCTNSESITVTVLQPAAVTVSGDETLCEGDSVQISANTGQPGYTYVWSPATGLENANQATTSAKPSTTTTYEVTASSPAGGCDSKASLTVTVNPLPVLTLSPDQQLCLGDSADLTVSGADTYTWSPNSNISSTTGASVQVFPTTPTYYKVVGEDVNGCIAEDSVLITLTPLPVVSAGTDIEICAGSATQLNAMPNGLASYSWSPNVAINNVNLQNPTVNPASTQDYVVTGTDANGCKDMDTVQVSVVISPSFTLAGTDSICKGDTTQYTITTGLGNTVLWSPNIGIDDVTSKTPKFFPAGNRSYKVVVSNPTGCKDSATVDIKVNPLPTVIISPDAEICIGGNTNLSASGGTSYTWSPSTGLSSTTGSTVIANPTSTTTYTVEIEDAKNCSNKDSVVVTVNPLPNVSAGTDAEICKGTSVQLNGNPNGLQTYTWSPAATLDNATIQNPNASPLVDTEYILIGEDVNGCENSDTVDVSVIAIPPIGVSDDTTICIGESVALSVTTDAANSVTWSPNAAIDDVTSRNPVVNPTSDQVYKVVVENPTGCKDSAEVLVSVNPLPTITLSPDVEICIGESTTLTASGGSTYNWSPSTGLSATTGSSVTANPTTTTTYKVTLEDANQCANEDSVLVTVNPLPVISAGTDVEICKGTSVQLNASPAGLSFYSWTPTVTLDNPTVANPNATPLSTTDYVVLGEDANGCRNSDTVNVSIVTIPALVTSSDTSICIGESVTMSVTTAVGNSVLWSPNIAIDDVTSRTPTVNPTSDQVYKVVVENPTGCKDSSTVSIQINPLPTGTIVADKNPLCFGETGNVTIALDGGLTQNVNGSFSVNGGAFTNVSNYVYAGNKAGDSTINVVFRDITGCLSSTESLTMTTLDQIAFDTSITQLPSCTVADGSVLVDNISGGVSPYTIFSGATSVVADDFTFTNLGVGTHTFTVTGDNGCSESKSVTFTGPISFDSTVVDPTCYGENNGSISISNVAGGVAPYQFSFDNNASYGSVSDFTGLTAGSYVVYIQDDTGCELPIGFTLNDPDSISITEVSRQNILCAGYSGEIVYDISGGTGVLNIVQGTNNFTGAGTYTFNVTTAGTQTVTVTDANSCTKTQNFTIIEEQPLETYLSLQKEADCNIASGVVQIDSTTGGSGFFQYGFLGSGSFKDSTSFASDLDGLNAGTYNVVTRDLSFGCSDTTSITVTRVAGIDVTAIVKDITPSCTNLDGIIALSNITGGAPKPYEFELQEFATGTIVQPRQLDSVFTSVAAGNYKVVIYDNLNCPEELPITVPNFSGLTITVDSTDETCNLSNGEIELTVSGGTLPYFTSIDNGATFAPKLTYSALSAGNYKILVQDNSAPQTCIDSVEVELENIISKPTGTLTITKDTVCFGETVSINAQLDAKWIPNPNGSYSYDKGVSFSPVKTFDYNATVAGDTAFYVVFRDAINCVLSDTLKVSLHTTEEVDFNVSVIDTPTCTTPGSIQVNNYIGGTTPYMLDINGGGFVTAKDTTLSNVGPGLYAFTVEDAKGCSATESVDLTGVLTYDVSKSEPTCFGDTDGEIRIFNVDGGVAPYEFSFNDNLNYSVMNTFTNLSAGNYVVYIRDATGCEIPVSEKLIQPDSLFIKEVSKVDIGCENDFGELTVEVSGGSEPLVITFNTSTETGAGNYTYSNLPGGKDTIFVEDLRGCTNEFPFEIQEVPKITTFISQALQGECNQTVGKAVIDSTVGGSGSYDYKYSTGSAFLNKGDMELEMDSLPTGIYVVITQDNVFNCLDTTNFSITRKSGVDSLEIISNNSCNNVNAYLEIKTVYGSAPKPFMFELRDGFNTDSLIYPKGPDSLFSALSSGNYVVSVYDSLDCREDFLHKIADPALLDLDYSVNPDSCGDTTGAIHLNNFRNGLAPYEFSLDNQSSFSTVSSFENLVGGFYSVYMRDGSDPKCENKFDIYVPSTIVSVDDTVIDVSCYLGDNGAYEFFEIYNADTAKYDYGYSLDPTVFGKDSVFTNLTAGSYSLYVKQTNKATGNACIYAAWRTVYIYEEDTDVIIDTVSRTWFDVEDGENLYADYDSVASKFEEPTGSVIVNTITGGLAPYQISFEGADFIDHTAPTVFDNLAQTVTRDKKPYTVVLQDAQGCLDQFKVNVPSEFYVPNIFTPNGDGTNDTFYIMGLENYTRVKVYDRWGTLSYENNNYNNDWDGGSAPDGTYFYEIRLPDRTLVSGWVTIAR